jgi:transcriptional regulator with XRE-family HTH domain
MPPKTEVREMKRPLGPTIPRWQLGESLRRLREGMEQKEAAKHLACSVSKIQNIEAGRVRIVKAELESLLNLYGVTDLEERERYMELQKIGNTRGWWSKYGRLPTPFAEFLGIESAATQIEIFEPLVVTGLMQTKDYARAHEAGVTPGQTAEQVERQVNLRMDRQEQVLKPADGPEIWVVYDESVLHRTTGGPKVLRDQLLHLIDLTDAKTVTLQIVPFEHGGYPGTLGKVSIYSFDEELHTPVGYVESQAGNLYMEKPDELRRLITAYTHIRSTALSPEQSVKMLKHRVQILKE